MSEASGCQPEGKDDMGKRFAIVIGVAAAGVMALGAQTATSTTGEPVDRAPPDLRLSGAKKQSPQTGRRFAPALRCDVLRATWLSR